MTILDQQQLILTLGAATVLGIGMALELGPLTGVSLGCEILSASTLARFSAPWVIQHMKRFWATRYHRPIPIRPYRSQTRRAVATIIGAVVVTFGLNVWATLGKVGVAGLCTVTSLGVLAAASLTVCAAASRHAVRRHKVGAAFGAHFGDL